MIDIIDTFLSQLNLITPIPAGELKKLKAISNLDYIKKGEYFLKQGERSPNIAFVVSGLFRVVYLTEDGKEFTKSFLPEQDFLIAYSALIQDRESYFSIEALEDSTVIVINFIQWKEMFQNEVSWYKMLVHVLEKAFCKKEAREREFLLYDATARYKSFLNTYPNLANRIKQHMIASYLGITPVAFSNLKKRIKT
ncbi:MAG: Crp/Fnr family transcriptional regulator [Proteobacteria bacterium]|nr:Crp/Fnr family transcriptional regulator [Pseudomonadota bacterium]